MTKKPATKAERDHMGRVASLGCIICGAPATVHHCGTYMGGGRNHMKTIPLCWRHHLGPEGIDGKQMAKRKWEELYGTEEQLMQRTMMAMARLYPTNTCYETNEQQRQEPNNSGGVSSQHRCKAVGSIEATVRCPAKA